MDSLNRNLTSFLPLLLCFFLVQGGSHMKSPGPLVLRGILSWVLEKSTNAGHRGFMATCRQHPSLPTSSVLPGAGASPRGRALGLWPPAWPRHAGFRVDVGSARIHFLCPLDINLDNCK